MTSIAAVWQKEPPQSPRRRRFIPSAVDSYAKEDFLHHATEGGLSSSPRPQPAVPSAAMVGIPRLDLTRTEAAPVRPALQPPPSFVPEREFRSVNQLVSGKRSASDDGSSSSATGCRSYIALAHTYHCPPFSRKRVAPGTPRGQLFVETLLTTVSPRGAPASPPRPPAAVASSPATSARGGRGADLSTSLPSTARGSQLSDGGSTWLSATLSRVRQPPPSYHLSLPPFPHHGSVTQRHAPSSSSPREGRDPSSVSLVASPPKTSAGSRPPKGVFQLHRPAVSLDQVYSIYAQGSTDKSLLAPDYGAAWSQVFDATLLGDAAVRRDLAAFELHRTQRHHHGAAAAASDAD